MEQFSLTSSQQKEIAEVLRRFGLNESDQATYLSLLPQGSATLSPIARAAGLPVTTVQSALGRLVDLGIVRMTKKKSRHAYDALDPVMLRRILERQTEEVAGVIPLLQKMRTDSGAVPAIRVYYRERVADIFHQALASKGKLVHEIVSASDLQEVLGEKFHFTRRRVKGGIRLKSLRVEAREIKKYSRSAHVRELREAKFLPREMTFRCSIMFWDDTVAFFAPREEGLAWTVRSVSTCETFAQLFELLWSVGRKMETAAE